MSQCLTTAWLPFLSMTWLSGSRPTQNSSGDRSLSWKMPLSNDKMASRLVFNRIPESYWFCIPKSYDPGVALSCRFLVVEQGSAQVGLGHNLEKLPYQGGHLWVQIFGSRSFGIYFIWPSVSHPGWVLSVSSWFICAVSFFSFLGVAPCWTSVLLLTQLIITFCC